VNKKIFGVFISLLAVAILVTPLLGIAYAKKPEFVSGNQVVTGGVPISEVLKGKSHNVLSVAELTVSWTGQIEGVAVYEGTLMIHSMDPVAINVHEKIHFDEVTVLGKEGSLTLQVCANLGRGVDAGFRWTVIDGTDELANLHGRGTYWLADPINGIYDYEGYVHFDP
jgi:hypothetical protein